MRPPRARPADPGSCPSATSSSDCAGSRPRSAGGIERRRHVFARDDLAIAFAGLLVDVGRAHDALGFLDVRRFQPFEGGEGRVIAAYDRATRPSPGRTATRSGRRRRAPAPRSPPPDTSARGGIRRTGRRTPRAAGRRVGDARRRCVRPSPVARGPGRGGPHAAVAPTVTPATSGSASPSGASARAADAETGGPRWTTAPRSSRPPRNPHNFATSLPELLLFPVDSAERRATQAQALRRLADAGRAAAAEVQA